MAGIMKNYLQASAGNYLAAARKSIRMIGRIELIEFTAYVGLMGSLGLLGLIGVTRLAGSVILGVSILSLLALYELSYRLDESRFSLKDSEKYLEQAALAHEEGWTSSKTFIIRLRPEIKPKQLPANVAAKFYSPFTKQSQRTPSRVSRGSRGSKGSKNSVRSFAIVSRSTSHSSARLV